MDWTCIRAGAPHPIRLSALLHSRGQITGPRWRLDALLGLLPAARAVDVSVEKITKEIRKELAWVDAHRRHGYGHTLARSQLERLIELDGGRSKRLSFGRALRSIADSLWKSSREAAVCVVAELLRVRMHASARENARDAVGHNATYREALSLIRSEYVGRNLDRELLADLGIERASRFVPSLPHMLAVIDYLAGNPEVDIGDPTEALASMSPRDAQLARTRWVRLAYARGGIEPGMAAVRAVRYRNLRDLGRLLLIHCALQDDHVEHAELALADIRGRLTRQRGQLAVAAAISGTNPEAAVELLGRIDRPELGAMVEYETLRLRLRDGYGVAPRWRQRPEHRPTPRIAAIRPEPCLVTLANLAAARAHEAAGANGGWSGALRHARAMVRSLERWHIDPGSCMRWLRRTGGCNVAGAFWAELIAHRAGELIREPTSDRYRALDAGVRQRDLDAAVERVERGDIWSLPRTYYDEGLSMSEGARQRRVVLRRASYYCIKTALREPGQHSRELVCSRIRVLLNIGGPAEAEKLETLLLEASAVSAHFLDAHEALWHLDARRAAGVAIARGPDLVAAGVNVRRILGAIEDFGGLPCGFAASWERLFKHTAGRLGKARGIEWVCSLIDGFRARAGRFPTADALDGATALAHGGALRNEGASLLQSALARVDAALSKSTTALAQTLARDHVLRSILSWTLPARVGGADAWQAASWTRMMRRLDSSDSGRIDNRIVQRFLRHLRRAFRGPARQALLRGSSPTGETTWMAGSRLRVRLLDKRRDVLTFLRFPDVAACCYNSRSEWYFDYDNQLEVLRLWKDPLAYSFHIERHESGRWKPIGFVFGGVALLEARPVAWLNGIYLRKQSLDNRAAVLDAIERGFLAPLGVSAVGVAALHNGRGPMPNTYERRNVTLERLRALRTDSPITCAGDDVSFEINSREHLGHLYWKDLVRTATSSTCSTGPSTRTPSAPSHR